MNLIQGEKMELNYKNQKIIVEDYSVDEEEISLTSAYFEESGLELTPRELDEVSKQKQFQITKGLGHENIYN